MKTRRTIGSLLIILAMAGMALPQSQTTKTESKAVAQPRKPLVTFVELGSVKCIPCKQMQPVMKAIEEKYGKQISVVFYDVWKPEQQHYAEQYGIKLIPTQVFLDKDGKEFFRHEGFYPEAEIDKLLQKRGLKILVGG
jgi:thioredoxin 1